MTEIKKLLELCGFISLKIVRNQNRIALSLANVGRSGGSTTCWLHQVPDNVKKFVLADYNIIFEEKIPIISPQKNDEYFLKHMINISQIHDEHILIHY